MTSRRGPRSRPRWLSARSGASAGQGAPLLEHPVAAATGAACLILLAVGGVCAIAGPRQVARVVEHIAFRPVLWAVLVGVASLARYAAAYGAVLKLVASRQLPRRTRIGLVIDGFGAFSIRGGMSLDRRALCDLGFEPGVALRAVLVLSWLELVSLMWIAFVAGLVAMLTGAPVSGTMTWPWLVGVPLGTAAAALLGRATPRRRGLLARPTLAAADAGLRQVMTVAGHPWRFAWGWAGIVGYWLADVATLYFALRAFDVHLAFATTTLGYASGYLFSRRTLPFEGALIVEVVMTFSLYWLHVALPSALAAVALYRLLTLLLAALPASFARRRLTAA